MALLDCELLEISSAIAYSTSIHYLISLFNSTATTQIYTLSLHDALPILDDSMKRRGAFSVNALWNNRAAVLMGEDRNSTRLNSSHQIISYAVFCLKKKRSPCAKAPEGCMSVVSLRVTYKSDAMSIDLIHD